MAKPKKLSKKEIDEAAATAAAEAVQEFENETIEEDTFDDPGTGFSMSGDDSFAKDDVFEEGFRKAQGMNTAVRYHIKKDSQFLCVKGYPYSWEKLQKEYGPGYYMIIAKSLANGQILKKQSDMVGDPTGGLVQEEETEHEAPSKDNNFAYMTFMQQMQDRAETRARQDATRNEGSMAAVLQTVVQMQQQTTQMIMAQAAETNKLIMAMNQSKGPDPAMQLLTSVLVPLINQKPAKDDNGFTMANVLKMTQDAEARAEARVNKMQEQIEKKATELFEVKAETLGTGEEEDTGFKGLIKGFIPVLTQMVAQHQANQPSPEQIAMMQEQRRLQGGNGGLDQGFLNELADRPTIPAARPVQRPPQQRPAQSQPSVAQTGAHPVPVQTAQPPPMHIDPTKLEVQSNQTPDLAADTRRKDEIFNFCAPDIGNAMINGEAASKTASRVLEKLEKEGLSRQTVANTFRLEDFYGYADKYALPEEAKPWLKEFHDAIQESARTKSVQPAGGTPVGRTAPTSRPAATPVGSPAKVVNGPVGPAKVVSPNTGNGAARPVAAKRSQAPGTQPRTQPRQPTKDL